MAEGEHDPRAVLVTDNAKVAETVIAWLASEGIAAEVFVPPPKVTSDPLTGMTEGAPVEEFEVRVTDPGRAEDAKKLLGDAQRAAALREIRDKRSHRTGTVTAVCEECGKSSEWPAVAMGTTEVCPHCQAYMDIPDPDDDQWSDVDFGKDEEEEAEKE
jgi:hypothetical protein